MPVSVTKNTPLDWKTGGKLSFQKTKSGAGLQFLLLDCRARACTKGVVLFTDTGGNKQQCCQLLYQSLLFAAQPLAIFLLVKGRDSPELIRGNHLSNATRLTRVFFKSDE